REGARLLRGALGLRANDLRARGGRGRTRRRGVHARLPPPRAGSLPRDHDDEAVARDAEEPQAAEGPRALPRRPHQALLQARRRATGAAIPPRARLLTAPDPPVGEVYLSAEDIAARVQELGAEITDDYRGREPLLVAALKASVVFVTDLSRAIGIPHALDFVELAGYAGAATGGHSGIRLLKDLDEDVAGRDVVVVEDVVDTGLTLNYLCRTLSLRRPASLAVATLLDRPYRRLVDALPVRYVGFT